MRFKDVLAQDIEAVFLTGDEFSETHQINGKAMTAQVDSAELSRRNRIKINVNNGGRTVYAKETLLFVRQKDFGPAPKAGSVLRLDGSQYTVTAVSDETGILSISLEAMRA